MFDKIVVGTDGSETANKAVARAIELAAKTGDALHIVTAFRAATVGKLDAGSALPKEYSWMIREDSGAESVLNSAVLQAQKAGVPVEIHSVRGDPAEAIISTADEVGAHLIVVGSKGIERRIRGSVPNSITQDANCDVLVVHTT